MNEHIPAEAAGGLAALLAKLAPPGIGAAIMILVDPPESKREVFARAFVAFACSYLFGDTLFDFLQTTGTFHFLDAAKRAHHVAVDGGIGALGWAFTGGIAMLMRKWKADPLAVIRDAKDALK